MVSGPVTVQLAEWLRYQETEKRDCFDNGLFFWYNSQMDAKYKQGVAIGSNGEMNKKN